MIKIQIDNEKFNTFKSQYGKWFSRKTLKTIVATGTVMALTAGAGAAYAESDLYRQHKAQALYANKISANQAVDLALKQVSGQAVSVDFEHKLGDVGEISGAAGKRYEVDIISANGEKHEVGIDADSGQMLYNKTKTSKRIYQAPTVSLQQAIQTAQTKTGGMVKDAELDHEDGVLHYEIKTVAQNGAKQKVWIDSTTGQIVPMQKHQKHD